MVMAHGPSAKRPGEYDSSVVQVSGVFYSPKVFDVTRNFFVDDLDRMAADVVHPFLVKSVTGNSLTAARFSCIEDITSDEWVRDLIETFTHITLWRLHYEVASDVDGTLMYARTIGRAQ